MKDIVVYNEELNKIFITGEYIIDNVSFTNQNLEVEITITDDTVTGDVILGYL